MGMIDALWQMEDEDYQTLVLTLGVGTMKEIDGEERVILCHPHTLASLSNLLIQRGNNPESVAVGVWK